MSTRTESRPFIAVSGKNYPATILTPQHLSTLRFPAQPPASGTALADCLPLVVRHELSGWRAHRQSGLLLLDAELSPAWHQAPWETLHFEGEPLASTLLVVRRARTIFGELPPVRTRTSWLNLFPRTGGNGFDFAGALQEHIEAERLSRISPRWQTQHGLDGYSDLFILAHGDARGLLNKDGSPFALDTDALPRRVWLLACNLDGAMYRLAEELLARGVSTVIASAGEISAPEMAELLANWCERRGGITLEDWLLENRRDKINVEGGVHTLTIFGDCCVDRSEVASWNEMTWCSRNNAAFTLPRLADGDAGQFDAAMTALDSPALWTLTFEWLLPQALTTAENCDHQAMLLLQRRAKAVQASPSLSHALANTCYRRGYYDLTAKFVVEGLGCPSIGEIERAELLGVMTNLLIDMSLPGAARALAELHRNCQIKDFELRDRQGFKRLDWQARIALRQLRFDEALRLFETKRQQNLESDGSRELAWLLYTASWKYHKGEATPELVGYRDETVRCLAALPVEQIGKGNDGAAYLLRALACCRWCSGDKTLDGPLERWHALIDTGLTAHDPGPWAFTGAYLALSDPQSFVAFGQASLDALDRAGYWLEEAGFAALGGELDRETAAKKKFLAMREQVCAHLDPWLRQVIGAVMESDNQGHIPPI